MAGLSQKQKEFCMQYAKTGNATQAYINAGYKVKSEDVAGACAARLLGNARVQNYLTEVNTKLDADKVMSLEEARQRLTDIGRREACEITDENGEAYFGRPSIKEATKAMELIIRMNGGFIDKQQVEVSGSVGIADELKAALGRVKADDS